MQKIIIFTDSTCDLTKELLEEYDIHVVPLYIEIAGKSYKDGVDINTEQMYEMVENGVGFPKSSAPTPQDFYDAFLPYINDGFDIIYTGISSNMSSSTNHAEIAKEMFSEAQQEHIHVVDSKELSSGIGLLLLKAATWRKQGLDVKTIVMKMQEIVPHIRAQFCIETLEYLHKGGRCSSLTQIFGATFKIKPQIKVVDGNMGVYKKTVGTLSRAVSKMVDEFIDLFDGGDVDPEFVFITHSMSPNQALKIRDQISEQTPKIKHLYETNAGVVISTHCGPETIGILYIMK
ncbi:MAG: DegV family protein [Bacilli bacterium]|jgi:DegV family protein with EDD domain|nr:DegV family protein [Bacilli bacterium]MDD3422475.1 DegV family protein [Bacilli bacterium]MDD4066072.1 DegV family protein [Bacilli bacterium]